MALYKFFYHHHHHHHYHHQLVKKSITVLLLSFQVRSFSSEAGSVSSILKGIVSGPDSMLEKLLVAGEFQQATQLMTTVITVLNQDSSLDHTSDSADIDNRVEVSTEKHGQADNP